MTEQKDMKTKEKEWHHACYHEWVKNLISTLFYVNAGSAIAVTSFLDNEKFKAYAIELKLLVTTFLVGTIVTLLTMFLEYAYHAVALNLLKSATEEQNLPSKYCWNVQKSVWFRFRIGVIALLLFLLGVSLSIEIIFQCTWCCAFLIFVLLSLIFVLSTFRLYGILCKTQ